MKKLLLASAIAGLSAGLTAPAMAAENDFEQYQAAVYERGGSGVSGNAVFIPENGEMMVKLTIENADGMSAGIHAGLCRYAEDSDGAPEMLAFDEDPLFELSAIDGTESSSTIELTTEALMGDAHSVAIHDGSTIVACGNIQ
ncbi:hypothetical protein LV475_09235 [Guyparkeria hydrothermalis]|uniref:hypothetical protein n=1 Tax=Guyparkeria TaxID=2035712 RepID=UPI0010AC24A8|nr:MULTISPECIES: hypothetical protein [Guyparkeria]MCL7751772.1 hypothetical protein [Guyparkeria hydrothermalis]TKA89186.1 hypothetical protein FAZ79_06790 [Guyparkeria sp. SB14A]